MWKISFPLTPRRKPSKEPRGNFPLLILLFFFLISSSTTSSPLPFFIFVTFVPNLQPFSFLSSPLQPSTSCFWQVPWLLSVWITIAAPPAPPKQTSVIVYVLCSATSKYFRKRHFLQTKLNDSTIRCFVPTFYLLYVNERDTRLEKEGNVIWIPVSEMLEVWIFG